MSQHQQAFLADFSRAFDRVAHHALTKLISGEDMEPAIPNLANPKETTDLLDDLSRRLSDAATAQDGDQIWATIRDLQRAKLSSQTIKGAIVTNVARQLGEDWVNDTLSFGAVTIGCARLQAVVRHLQDVPPKALQTGTHVNCLVVVPKGNDHTLGAVVLTDQLRYAGASVKLALAVDKPTIAQLAQSQPFDAVMISASQGQNVKELAALVEGSRRGEQNQKVVIGGGILDEDADLVAATGSDYVTQDVREVLDFCTRDCCLG